MKGRYYDILANSAPPPGGEIGIFPENREEISFSVSSKKQEIRNKRNKKGRKWENL